MQWHCNFRIQFFLTVGQKNFGNKIPFPIFCWCSPALCAVCSNIHRLAFYDRIYISLKSQQKPVHCDQYIMLSLFCYVHLYLTLTFWKLRMIWENQSINHSYISNVFFDFWPPNGPILPRSLLYYSTLSWLLIRGQLKLVSVDSLSFRSVKFNWKIRFECSKIPFRWLLWPPSVLVRSC